MSKEFTQEEVAILLQVAREVEEVYVDDRKGLSQTKYVMEVPKTYDDFARFDGTNDKECLNIPVPKELVGSWMMSDSYSLQYDTLKDCIKGYDWVKCHKVEKTIEVWEKL